MIVEAAVSKMKRIEHPVALDLQNISLLFSVKAVVYSLETREVETVKTVRVENAASFAGEEQFI